MGCSRDVDDEVETNGDGYKAEYVLCEDGPYYLTFDKDYKLTGKEKQDSVEGPRWSNPWPQAGMIRR